MTLLWTQKQDVGSSARTFPSMTFDASRQRVVLFGGGMLVSNPFVWFGGTWQWDGCRWIERQDMGPQARMAAGLAIDFTRNRYVLFGGEGPPPAGSTEIYTHLGDTWETFDPAIPGHELAEPQEPAPAATDRVSDRTPTLP
jgi:hypothetical protein